MLMRVSFHDDRGRLGENGDAALVFEIVGIHGALGDALVVAEGAGLLEQLVDERGLAMVDVRDDRDISQFHGSAGGSDLRPGPSGAVVSSSSGPVLNWNSPTRDLWKMRPSGRTWCGAYTKSPPLGTRAGRGRRHQKKAPLLGGAF